MKFRSLPLLLVMAAFCFFTAEAQENNSSKLSDISAARFTIKNAPFNSENSDFGLFPFGANNFFFSSNRFNDKGANVKQSYNFNNLPFLDIYVINKNSDSTFSPPVALPGDAESKFNEGPIFYDANSSTFFITRNNYNKRKSQQSRNGVNRLKIYIENIDGTSFKSFGEFQFNNEQYSVGHAALSADGKRIYFASDMPGGFGGVDLYVSVKEGEKWGLPKNLGKLINTPGNEMFPFLAADDKLYFSTNGHTTTSGLDIYSAERNGEEYKNLKKLNAPFNSDQDDFSFYIYVDNKSGYFSSNRTGGKGDDDIYSFSISNPIIKGQVLDERGNSEVHFAKIKILTDDLKVKEISTDSAGNFSFEGQWGEEYTVEARKEGYIASAQSLTTSIDQTVFLLQYKLVKEQYGLEGQVINKDNNAGVPGATVSLLDKTSGKVSTINSDENGFYHFNVKQNVEYLLRVEKMKFITASLPVSTKGMSIGVKKQNILVEELKVGKTIKIENVYYDKGKWDVRADAKIELDKLIAVMNENPSMEIELSSHTDSRGSDASNLTLSENRAKAVAAYMVTKGISINRVFGKGYGETKLLNACTNGKKCSEAEHQVNRRTEFKILKIG